jgi:hypothetical protein
VTVTWVTPGKLLLRYPYDGSGRSRRDQLPVPLDTSTVKRVRHDAQSDHEKLFGQGGVRCREQNSEPENQHASSLAVSAETSAPLGSAIGSATALSWGVRS